MSDLLQPEMALTIILGRCQLRLIRIFPIGTLESGVPPSGGSPPVVGTSSVADLCLPMRPWLPFNYPHLSAREIRLLHKTLDSVYNI